jgi:hypothetical protein
VDAHGNYDIKIGKFANPATMAFSPISRIPILPAASKKAYGRIRIKVGNSANTIGSAPLVRFRTLWSASQPSRGEETMITCGLFVRLKAKPGKEQAVADFPAADRP